MKKCPNCGRILHDDSIFCFGCMSEINKRQEIVLATPKKSVFKSKNNHTNNRCGISIRNCFRGVYL